MSIFKKRFMSCHANADIVPVVKYTVMALQAFASSRSVDILFIEKNHRFNCPYNPVDIIHCLSQLLSRIITLLPAGSKVTIDTSVESNNSFSCCNLIIRATGGNLSAVAGITNNLTPPVVVAPGTDHQTCFTTQIAVTGSTEVRCTPVPSKSHVSNTTPFYQAIRKRLQGHFSRSNNYLENLEAIHPKKAAFLRKINDCITENVSDENFDVTALSRQMSMSRTQLFRKLKPIMSQAPAKYMRDVRLQKAKELLEAGEGSVSEVACKTGFKTPSHFTKVFTEKYGIRPSFWIIAQRV